MRVYLEPATYSRGILRVKDALIKYAPKNIEFVEFPSEADFIILHVFGRHTTTKQQIDYILNNNKKYAMIQYCLRSTMRPNTLDWIDMWHNAKLVWSYYDLKHLHSHDLLEKESTDDKIADFNFYYAPLGVDSNTFKLVPSTKKYIIFTSSKHALSESARECVIASQIVGKPCFFLGHNLRREGVVYKNNIYDKELAKIYTECEFVSGLRRVEGFELPVVEGALCGARPIVFDRPEMRHWYNDFAIFIPEGNRDEVVKSLVRVLEGGATPIHPALREVLRQRFNGETIIKGFWERIL